MEKPISLKEIESKIIRNAFLIGLLHGRTYANIDEEGYAYSIFSEREGLKLDCLINNYMKNLKVYQMKNLLDFLYSYCENDEEFKSKFREEEINDMMSGCLENYCEDLKDLHFSTSSSNLLEIMENEFVNGEDEVHEYMLEYCKNWKMYRNLFIQSEAKEREAV